ncbi:Ig-like domain repeat protein, partial [Klebsiella pneumoniae]|uniref:Ig-like domain repeat protein n=1 Tax=Klebsiella pneumoniae TaxID=573 RepID=UPI003853B0D0
GSTTLGTVAVDASGRAVFSTTTLPTGVNSITASYAGSSNYSSSTSGSVTVTIGAAATTTTLSSSTSSGVFGQSIVLTATVTSTSGT